MAVVDTIRPDTTLSIGAGWSLVGAASYHAALSDNSDASYGSESTTGNSLTVTGVVAAVPAGYQRHRYRHRLRRASSVAWELNTFMSPGQPVLILSGGPNGGGTGNPGEVIGPWTLMEAQGATVAGSVQWQMRRVGATGTLRWIEAYVDIDRRTAPTFTADVLDGAGVSRDGGIVSDTSRPVFTFDAVDYDGLTARTWSMDIYTDPGGVLVFQSAGVGVVAPGAVQSDPLPNGDYEARYQISSYIRDNDPYFSVIETTTFEVAFVAPATPDLTLTPILSPPAIQIDWTSDTPTGTAWDTDADVVTEIRRTDCNGTSTIYVERTGSGAATFTDRFMSLSYNGVFCDEEDHNCQVCYEARYWGEVDEILVATDWSTPVCDDVANPTPGNAWMRGADSGDISICPTETFDHIRPFGVFQPIGGGIPTVVTGTPGGRDYTLDFAVTSEADLVLVESILAQPLFFYQPVEQADIWLAPANQNMTVVKVKRIRTVNVPCVAVNPQPVTDPASLF